MCKALPGRFQTVIINVLSAQEDMLSVKIHFTEFGKSSLTKKFLTQGPLTTFSAEALSLTSWPSSEKVVY